MTTFVIVITVANLLNVGVGLAQRKWTVLVSGGMAAWGIYLLSHVS